MIWAQLYGLHPFKKYIVYREFVNDISISVRHETIYRRYFSRYREISSRSIFEKIEIFRYF